MAFQERKKKPTETKQHQLWSSGTFPLHRDPHTHPLIQIATPSSTPKH